MMAPTVPPTTAAMSPDAFAAGGGNAERRVAGAETVTLLIASAGRPAATATLAINAATAALPGAAMRVCRGPGEKKEREREGEREPG